METINKWHLLLQLSISSKYVWKNYSDGRRYGPLPPEPEPEPSPYEYIYDFSTDYASIPNIPLRTWDNSTNQSDIYIYYTTSNWRFITDIVLTGLLILETMGKCLVQL